MLLFVHEYVIKKHQKEKKNQDYLTALNGIQHIGLVYGGFRNHEDYLGVSANINPYDIFNNHRHTGFTFEMYGF